MRKKFLLNVMLALSLIGGIETSYAQTLVKLKDISRIQGQKEDALIGYGLVVGLAGSGDSRKNQSTIKSISNTLNKFDLVVNPNELNSKNVAAVMVTGKMTSFSEVGDKIDISVSAIGDARSLVGGTLLLTPLEAADGKIYALAQGQISVGGYKFEQFGNSLQKNHPTVGLVPKGATIEKGVSSSMVAKDGNLRIILKNEDFSQAISVSELIETVGFKSEVIHPGKILVYTNELKGNELVRAIANIQSLTVESQTKAIVVVNERTGTIVSGGNVLINPIAISHGNLKVEIKTQYDVSQPNSLFSSRTNLSNVRTTITPDTEISTNESEVTKGFSKGTPVFNLIEDLKTLGLSTRDIIVVLQAADKAGALNGELVLQ